MHRVARLIALIVLTVCLPLQTLGAVTMPFCEAGDMASANMAGMDHSMPMDHADHAMPHEAGGHGDQQPQGGMDCNECGLCHLACASALPSSMPVLSDVLQSVRLPAVMAHLSSFQPDLVLKPPRGVLR
jgi:hypothetical protein